MEYAFARDNTGAAHNDSGVLDLIEESTVTLIQETVGKITGLSVIILDGSGKMLANPAIMPPICRKLRRDKDFSAICKASDTYGADNAFAGQARFTYFCPCGLIRAVIPVISRGRYLGGFFLGHVRCDNAPGNVPGLERIRDAGENGRLCGRHYRDTLEATPTYDFSYFSYIAEILSRVVFGKIADKTRQHAKYAELEAEKDALLDRVRFLERELHIRESSLQFLRSRFNLEFMINNLNSMASLAILENAPRVNEMCALFADHLRHSLVLGKDFIPLREEMPMITGYLAMQRIRFGEALRYTLFVSDEAERYNVPTRVLLPLVENALLIGLATRETGYAMTISANIKDNAMVIRIEGNVYVAEGRGNAAGHLPMQSGFDTGDVASALAAARTRLKNLLDTRHELRFTVIPGGSACILRYTLPHMEDSA